MAKKKLKKKQQKPAQMEHVELQPLQFSGYSGANFSTKRGQIWWPTLNTKRELDSYSRTELIRKIRAIKANGGILKSFIQNGARLIGKMSPVFVSDDPDWNQLAAKHFQRHASAKGLFDVAGKFDFFTAQTMLLERALCDGDILTVLTENPFGSAQVAFYEAHQIQNPSTAKSDRWYDGVLTNEHGRHLRYGISSEDRETSFSARDCIYFGRFESSGHTRAHPPLAHAINHSADIIETRSDVKSAIKTNALSAMVRTTDSGAKTTTRSRGLPGRPVKETVNSDSGVAITREKVYAGSQIQSLAQGEDLKVVSDPRPHQNQQDFEKELIREMAQGYGLPPEVIYNVIKLTGTGVRFVMEFAGSWIRDWRAQLNSWVRRYTVYFIAKEIKAGRLPVPKDDHWMHAIDTLPTRDLTVDRGRDGKLAIDKLDVGLETWSSLYAQDGKFWQSGIDQRIREKKYAKDRCEKEGLTLAEVFPVRQGAAVAKEESTTKKTATTTEEEEE